MNRHMLYEPGTERQCGRCPDLFIGGGYGRFCSKCRGMNRHKLPARQRVYDWTPERDDYLRKHYRRGAVRAIAAHFGWPARAKTAITFRAGELGVSTRRGYQPKPWTPEETAFLEEHAGTMSVRAIAYKLGRSPLAVGAQCNKIGISSRVRDGYTIEALAACFGETTYTINRWLEQGLFGTVRYENGGTKRASSRDPVRLTEPQVYAFVRRHRGVFRLERVEQAWFLDLVFDQRQVVGNGKGVAA